MPDIQLLENIDSALNELRKNSQKNNDIDQIVLIDSIQKNLNEYWKELARLSYKQSN